MVRAWRARCVWLMMAAALAAPARAQPAAEPFTLAAALSRIGTEAPEVAATRARVDAARSAIDHAGRTPNPLAEFRVENWASGVSRSVLPFDTFAEVTQLIEIGGKRSARRGVAEAMLGTSEAAAAVTRVRLAREISRLYLETLRLRERQRSLVAQTGDLGEMARVLDRRVAVGTTAEAELLKLRTEEARAFTDLVRAELAASSTLIELTSRLNVETTVDALVLPPSPPLPLQDDGVALDRRPDVAAAGRAVELARRTLRLEDARGLPDPSVNAGLKRTIGVNTGVVTVTMPIPIFDRNRGARIVAQGQVSAAELELAATERRARGELAGARLAASRLAERARDVRARLVEPARGARDAARAAFASGALDVLRLVDAERVFTEATLVAIDIEIDAVAAAIDARLAAGEDPLP